MTYSFKFHDQETIQIICIKYKLMFYRYKLKDF